MNNDKLKAVRDALRAENAALKAPAPAGQVSIPAKFVLGFAIEDGRLVDGDIDLGALKDGSYNLFTAPVMQAASAALSSQPVADQAPVDRNAVPQPAGDQLRAIVRSLGGSSNPPRDVDYVYAGWMAALTALKDGAPSPASAGSQPNFCLLIDEMLAAWRVPDNNQETRVRRMKARIDLENAIKQLAWQNSSPTQSVAPSREEADQASAEPVDISVLVNRFLGWRLPETFAPDCGITFKPLGHPNGWPVGTNLFTANEARAMFEYVLADAAPPAPAPAEPMPVSQEPKYGICDGRLFNRSSDEFIPADEPVFILRARDRKSLEAINYYADLCADPEHEEAVARRVLHFHNFSIMHPQRMKYPDTDTGAHSSIAADQPAADKDAVLLPVLRELLDAAERHFRGEVSPLAHAIHKAHAAIAADRPAKQEGSEG